MKKQKTWIKAYTDSASDLVPMALHIERNDELYDELPDGFDDFDAARDAMEAGVKLIDDIEGIYKNLYIDTKKNRKIIAQYMAEHPEEVGRELIGNFDKTK